MGLTLDWTLAVTTTAILGALISVIGRIGHMHKGQTRVSVFIQHLVLGAGLALALALPPKYAVAPLALGIGLFLSIGGHRWRHGAPEGTRKEKSTWK